MNLHIDVEKIPAQGLNLSLCEPAERFPALIRLAADEGIRLVGPVAATVSITPEKGMFRVQGCVKGKVDIPCSRCLQRLHLEIEETFSLTYADHVPGGDEAVVELTAADMGMEQLAGGRIDLAEALQEQVVMGLPMRPLCRQDCKGLCPACGADLNTETCTCASPAKDPRFAVLEKLKTGGKAP